jgi:hypothetical protein
LDDEEIFIDKYIHKKIEREELSAFDVGTYFHTAVLEPDKIQTDCAVYSGRVRRGAEWDSFKRKHNGKAILTPSQREQAVGLVEAVKNSPVAMSYLEGGVPEVSLFNEISIHRDAIYSEKFKKELTIDGWKDISSVPDKLKSRAIKTVIKVRADYLNPDRKYVIDLKSTTGNSKSANTMRQKISYYQYELSAALYMDMFSLISPIEEFIWIFSSKDFKNSRSYKASPTNIKVGRAKYMKALFKLAECMRNEWQVSDYLGVLEPLPYELEHIKEKETDLL